MRRKKGAEQREKRRLLSFFRRASLLPYKVRRRNASRQICILFSCRILRRKRRRPESSPAGLLFFRRQANCHAENRHGLYRCVRILGFHLGGSWRGTRLMRGRMRKHPSVQPHSVLPRRHSDEWLPFICHRMFPPRGKSLSSCVMRCPPADLRSREILQDLLNCAYDLGICTNNFIKFVQ